MKTLLAICLALFSSQILAAPAAPASISVTSVHADRATLYWDAVVDARKYNVYLGGSFYDSTIANIYTAVGFSQGVQHVFSVSAIDGLGQEGPRSENLTFTTKPLEEVGRSSLAFYATAVPAGATGTETPIYMTRSSGTKEMTDGDSFVFTASRTFRVTNLLFAVKGHETPTAQETTFRFRINNKGAVSVTSNPVVLEVRVATPATSNAWDRVTIPVPDGLEYTGDGVMQFGITAAATYTTNAPTWDVLITGFEY